MYLAFKEENHGAGDILISCQIIDFGQGNYCGKKEGRGVNL